MALNATILGGAIRTALLAAPASGATDNAALTAMCNAIATAVVAHILTAQVAVVTACPAGAGTGTGAVT